MLLGRTKELIEGGGQMLRAEAELATRRLWRAVVSSALLLGVLLVAGVAVGMLIAATTIALASIIGTAGALAAVGGTLALLSAVLLLAVWMRRTNSGQDLPDIAADQRFDPTEQPKEALMEAKQDMKDAVTPGGDHTPGGHKDAPGASNDPMDLKDAAIDFVAKNPVAVGSAVFLALSVIGPGRALRMVSRGAAAAGMIATIADKLREDDDPQPVARQPEAVARH